MAETKKAERLPNKFEACLPVLVLLGLMVANSVLEWGNDPHLYVLMAVITVVLVAKRCGICYKDMPQVSTRFFSHLKQCSFCYS